MKTKNTISILCLQFMVLWSSFAQVGIGTEEPLSDLHIKSDSGNSEIRVDGDNSAKFSLDANTTGLYLNQREVQKGALIWSSKQLKFFSSPIVDGPFFDYYLPSLTLTEERRVGINTPLTATPSQSLDVFGKIKVGNDETAPTEGTIRWNQDAKDFEGYNGTSWLSLTNNQNSTWPSDGSGSVSDFFETFVLFPLSLCINDDFAFVSTDLAGINDDGVIIYRREGRSWIAFDTLKNTEFTTLGRSLDMEVTDDLLVIGNPLYEHNGINNVGAVTIFRRNGTAWNFDQSIINTNGNSDDNFGQSVSVLENFIVVGEPNHQYVNGIDVGTVKTYIYQNGSWNYNGLIQPSNLQEGQAYGYSVDLAADKIVIGAPNYDYPLGGGNFAENIGQYYLYTRQGNTFQNEEKPFSFIGLSLGEQVSINQYGDYIVSYQSNNIAQTLNTVSNTYSIKYFESGTSSMVPLVSDMNGDFAIIGTQFSDYSENCDNIVFDVGSLNIYKFENGLWKKISEVWDTVKSSGARFGYKTAISKSGWFTSIGRTGNRVVFGRAQTH